MQKRKSVTDRKIEVARRLRTLQGAAYGDGNKTIVELPINDQQFILMQGRRSVDASVQEFNLEGQLAIRILNSKALVSIGNARFVDADAVGMLPVSYDGNGMFWWLKARPVLDVAAAIRDDALSFVDNAMAAKIWSDEDDAKLKASEVLSTLRGQYAVLPDNTILTGSVCPGFRLNENFGQIFLSMIDIGSERLQPPEPQAVDFGSLPLVFGILEHDAANQFMELMKERNPDRRNTVGTSCLIEPRDMAWMDDFTTNRERWAGTKLFMEYVSRLSGHINAMRLGGDKYVRLALEELQFGAMNWSLAHDEVEEKLDKILDLRESLLQVKPSLDDLLVKRLKWPVPVKPLELLEIRTRGLKKLIVQPAMAPSI
jgi:hypothetical protein